MTPSRQKLVDRHNTAVKRLQEVASKKEKKNKNTQIAAIVGEKLGISGQTVINYLNGQAKDGYTTEALIAEYKQLKLQ